VRRATAFAATAAVRRMGTSLGIGGGSILPAPSTGSQRRNARNQGAFWSSVQEKRPEMDRSRQLWIDPEAL
jgi:hypothetical protein